MTGEIIGHYKIISQIGSGGMGAVYLAEDQKLQREIALKVLPAELASNLERFERFQREARSVAALNHPNIVTLYSVEEDNGTHFITMELVKGKPLNKLIPTGGQSVEHFLDYAVQVADALATAHEKGITHRDLKPANVMIDDSGRVKVIDFGLAKANPAADSIPDLSQLPTEQLTMEGRIIGTPSYMAPEQVEGKPVDHRTDIFSLGILFHEMLVGERPFKGDSNMSIMSAILKDEPSTLSDLRPEIPFEISRVIRRCLQKDPTERFQSALDIRNELKELQSDFLTGTLTSVNNPPVASTEKNRIVNWTMGIVGVNLVLAVIAFFAWPRDDDGETSSRKATTPSKPLGQATFTMLTTTERLEMMPTFSPDGNRIAFVAQVGDFKQIFIRAIGSSESTQLTEGNYDFIQPSWGPNTNTIYYARSAAEGESIMKGESTGSEYQSRFAHIFRHDIVENSAELVVRESNTPSVAPGGKNLYYTRRERIWMSDLRGGREVQLSVDDDSMEHANPRVSNDESKVVFRRFNLRERRSDLAVVTSNRVQTIVRTNGYNLYPTWHPDGNSIYFSLPILMGGRNIWRLQVDEESQPIGDPTPVTGNGTTDNEPAFSPDGKRMAFTIDRQNSDIYRIAIDPTTGRTNGPPAQKLPFNTNREESRASWAPDANQPMLAFNSDRDGEMNLYIWREHDNSVTRVTTGNGGDYQPTWSSDLQQLVYFSSPNGHSDIFVVGTNANSVPTRLTDNPGPDFNPFFSPDRRHIVFASVRESKRELYIMNADGSNQRRLVKGAAITHYHPWFDNDSVLNAVIPPEKESVDTEYFRIFLDGRMEPMNMLKPHATSIGGHGTISPDGRNYMELNYPHTHIWVLSLTEPKGEIIYQRTHPAAEIDYPWWSPDGNWATFDFAMPRSSELVMAEWPEE